MIHNPILRGFHPDPSICRVGEDYYMVTSSFSYFPGVPVFHSRDLAHWTRLGYVLDRKEQLHVTYEDVSMGIFAPTIRWHDGLFYMITTNITTHENFFCTASDPAGPWSDPVVIRDAGGIDPSLFWDDDGKVYFTGTAPWGDPRYDHPMVICAGIDMTTGQLVGEPWPVGDGAAKNATSPEGPHIYKRDGWYYLLIAEGGTEHWHAVTVSRSRDIRGPFEQCPFNPVLTHRHLGRNYPICNVGHADLVECQGGSWYAVCLGSRLVGGCHKPLGRETFLVPVVWEDGWPVFSPGTGRVERTYPAPAFAKEEPAPDAAPVLTENGRIHPDWNTLGTPYEDFLRVTGDGVAIRMLRTGLVPWEFEGKPFDFGEHMATCGQARNCMPFLGRRLAEPRFTMEVTMAVALAGNETAGIAILQNNAHQLRLEAAAEENGVRFRVLSVTYGLLDGKMHYEETVQGSALLPAGDRWRLRMEGRDNVYRFAVRPEPGGAWTAVADGVDGSHLGSETAGGFVGAYVGLFASGNGADADSEAVFTDLDMREERGDDAV